MFEVMKARAVRIRVVGLMEKKEYRRRLCGVEIRRESERVS